MLPVADMSQWHLNLHTTIFAAIFYRVLTLQHCEIPRLLRHFSACCHEQCATTTTTMLLNSGVAPKRYVNNKQFSLTRFLPWNFLGLKSISWLVSNSLTFPGFPYKWSPCLGLNALGCHFLIIISGLHHQECVAPLTANNLQSGRFWAALTASITVRLWDSTVDCLHPCCDSTVDCLHPCDPRAFGWSLPIFWLGCDQRKPLEMVKWLKWYFYKPDALPSDKAIIS